MRAVSAVARNIGGKRTVPQGIINPHNMLLDSTFSLYK